MFPLEYAVTFYYAATSRKIFHQKKCMSLHLEIQMQNMYLTEGLGSVWNIKLDPSPSILDIWRAEVLFDVLDKHVNT